jgi:hypothetical protein
MSCGKDGDGGFRIVDFGFRIWDVGCGIRFTVYDLNDFNDLNGFNVLNDLI